MLKGYFQVVKPGIICGNLISMIGGFLLASKGRIDYTLFVSTLTSVSLIIASGCVFNNFIDRDIDKKMERTKNRVLVQGLIHPIVSLVYATFLGFFGFSLMLFFTNYLSFWLGIIGFIIYVVIYSLYIKPNSIYSTLVGSLSGSIPPVIGYCVVTNKFDIGAFILQIIFILWQIPHSYTIAIFRLEDYRTANIPILPVVKGILVAKKHINLYILAFTIATIMLTVTGYTGSKYLIVTSTISFYWLNIALRGYDPTIDDRVWANKLFMFSIFTIMLLSVMMSIDFKS